MPIGDYYAMTIVCTIRAGRFRLHTEVIEYVRMSLEDLLEKARPTILHKSEEPEKIVDSAVFPVFLSQYLPPEVFEPYI